MNRSAVSATTASNADDTEYALVFTPVEDESRLGKWCLKVDDWAVDVEKNLQHLQNHVESDTLKALIGGLAKIAGKSIKFFVGQVLCQLMAGITGIHIQPFGATSGPLVNELKWFVNPDTFKLEWDLEAVATEDELKPDWQSTITQRAAALAFAKLNTKSKAAASSNGEQSNEESDRKDQFISVSYDQNSEITMLTRFCWILIVLNVSQAIFIHFGRTKESSTMQPLLA